MYLVLKIYNDAFAIAILLEFKNETYKAVLIELLFQKVNAAISRFVKLNMTVNLLTVFHFD